MKHRDLADAAEHTIAKKRPQPRLTYRFDVDRAKSSSSRGWPHPPTREKASIEPGTLRGGSNGLRHGSPPSQFLVASDGEMGR